jgi:uncharacterized cupin superfamily protein
MADLFDLTATYVTASGNTATTFEGGENFWRRLADNDPALASASTGWLVSSYLLQASWPNWEMHPQGDEIVHCQSGLCQLILERPDGPDSNAMTPGTTIVIKKGTWHTVQVTEQTELLHITFGSGTTFKPATSDIAGPE